MRRVLICAAACLLSAASCISFEKQTLSFRYDKATDTLRIFQVYEGIYGSASDTELNADETKEILSVLREQRTFFFANWIFEFNRPDLEDSIRDIEERPQRDTDPRKEAALQESRKLIMLLLANVTVKNGSFFLNGEEKLSGYQYVTVEHASQVIAQANRTISAWVLASGKDLPEALSGESKQKILAAARRGYEWIRLDTACLVVRCPLSHRDVMAFRRKAAARVLSALSKKEGREAALAELAETAAQWLLNDIWAWEADGAVTARVGHPSRPYAAVMFTINRGKYKPNVVAFAKQHGGIAADADIAAERERFLLPRAPR